MVTVAPGQNSAAPQSERGAVPASPPSEAPPADARLTEIVGEARDLQATPEESAAPAAVSLPDPGNPGVGPGVALPEDGPLPGPVFLTNADRAQAIRAYETAQNLTESGRILLRLNGDASPPERQAA